MKPPPENPGRFTGLFRETEPPFQSTAATAAVSDKPREGED